MDAVLAAQILGLAEAFAMLASAIFVCAAAIALHASVVLVYLVIDSRKPE